MTLVVLFRPPDFMEPSDSIHRFVENCVRNLAKYTVRKYLLRTPNSFDKRVVTSRSMCSTSESLRPCNFVRNRRCTVSYGCSPDSALPPGNCTDTDKPVA